MERNLVIDGMRGYLIDLHRGNLPQVNFDGFDREKIRRLIRKSNIDNIMVYAKDHCGYAYYPSKIGPIHPKLESAGFDFLKEVKDIAESEGVDVCIYYSIDTDDYAAKQHPDWQVIDSFGKPVTAGDRWRRCAIAHGYDDYVLTQVGEILSEYHPKGMFFDCFPSVLCFCDKCREHYKAVMGAEMPLGKSADEKWRDLYRYEEKYYWLPFAIKLRTLFNRVSPQTKLTTNGCNPNMPDSIMRLYDYHYAEPWAGNYISAGFVRNTMKSPQIGPGNVGLVYDDTPEEVIKRELLSIGMQGARPFLYSESMRNDASMEEHEWERIGKAYESISQIEKYWKNAEILSDIDILYSQSSHLFAPERKNYDANWWSRGSKHLDNLQAAMALSASCHKGYRVINADKLQSGDRFDRESLAIIPNTPVLTQNAWEAIAQHVRGGGKAVVILDSMPKDEDGNIVKTDTMENLFGCSLLEEDNSFLNNGISSYAKFDKNCPFYNSVAHFPLGVTGTRLKIKADTAEVWAEYIEPVLEVDVSKGMWMAWRPPNPGIKVCGPAVIRNRFGKGEVVLITFDILGMARKKLALETGFANQDAQEWYWPDRFFSLLVNGIMPSKRKVEGVQENVFVNFMHRNGELFIHILNNDKLHGVYPGEAKIVLDKKLYSDIGEIREVYPRKKILDKKICEKTIEIPIETNALYTVYSAKL